MQIVDFTDAHIEQAANIAKQNTCLGVDFESINPSAYGFWSKDFNAYTYGVVRRIDESVINNR